MNELKNLGEKVWHFHPVKFIELLTSYKSYNLGKIFTCVKYRTFYGPQYSGSESLEQYLKSNSTLINHIISIDESEIFKAVSPNEGNLDALQSYDSEIFSAGAMQKTVNNQGGEFSKQVLEFKQRKPALYIELFNDYGWFVTEEKEPKMYFIDHESGIKYFGTKLREFIRKDYTNNMHKKKLECIPLESILIAIKNPSFQELQLIDFQNRLKEVLNKIVSGFKLQNYVLSNLGRAVLLDQHINRPAWVARDFKNSLNNFFSKHPEVSKNPQNWAANHSRYERTIIDDYAITRDMSLSSDGKPVAPIRYARIKSQLGIK